MMYYLSPPTRRQLRSTTLRGRLFTSSMLGATINQSRGGVHASSPKADSVHSVSPNRVKVPSSDSSASSCSACDREGAFFNESMLADPQNQSVMVNDSNDAAAPMDEQADQQQQHQLEDQSEAQMSQADQTEGNAAIEDGVPKPRKSRIDALDLADASMPKSIQAALTASRISGSAARAQFNDYQERVLVLELLRAEELDALTMAGLGVAEAYYRDAGSESSRLTRVIRSLQSTAARARKPHTLYEHYSTRPTRLFPGDASEVHTGVLIPLNDVWPSLVPRTPHQQLSLWLLLETDPSIAGVGMLVQSSLFLSNEGSGNAKKNSLEPLYCQEFGYDTGVIHHKTVTSLKQHIKELDKLSKEYAIEVVNSSAETAIHIALEDEEEQKEASPPKSKKRARRSSRADSASKKKRVLEPLRWEYFNETVLDRFEASPLFHCE